MPLGSLSTDDRYVLKAPGSTLARRLLIYADSFELRRCLGTAPASRIRDTLTGQSVNTGAYATAAAVCAVTSGSLTNNLTRAISKRAYMLRPLYLHRNVHKYTSAVPLQSSTYHCSKILVRGETRMKSFGNQWLLLSFNRLLSMLGVSCSRPWTLVL